MTALEEAYLELGRRYRAADSAGDWQERSLLCWLMDVADYTRRIGDVTHSTHYRADKAAPLVHAALNVQHEALLAYAGWPDGENSEYERLQEKHLHEARTHAQTLVHAVTGVMWDTARPGFSGGVGKLTVSDLKSAIADVAAWARELDEIAIDDGEL